METFMHIWPWMGLGAAIVLLILLFCTNWLQADKDASRWRDPTWFAWLTSCAYMLHNVEEYGMDATGSALAFPNMMLGLMGEMPHWFFFLCVNLALVWVMGPLAAMLSKRYPTLCFGMMGIEAINCLTHIPGAIALGSVSGGFVTAVALFVPITVWGFVGVAGKQKRGLSRKCALGYVGLGLLYHLGLFANMPLFITGVFNGYAMGTEMLCVSAIIFGLWVWVATRQAQKQAVAS